VVEPRSDAQGAAAGAQPGARVDPYRAYNFKLIIQGVVAGHFVECTGLGAKVQAIRYQEGGSQTVYRIPGQVEYSDVTLRYGLTTSAELWTWFMKSIHGPVERLNVSVLVLDPDSFQEVMRWNLIDAWPSEWRGASLDALTREIAIESVTLVYESLERA
jgi:phage tail-like protein